MDPMWGTRPKSWKVFGRLALILLVGASVTGAGGWAAASRGLDPATAYRLAVPFGAGGMVCGLIWAVFAGMDDGI